jgi:lysophospholipase L1-like esterase
MYMLIYTSIYINAHRSLLPQYNLEISNYGVNGDNIFLMRSRLDVMLSEVNNTYAFILFWDSDVSDVSEYKMHTNEIAGVRESFQENLRYVLTEIKKRKPDAFIAVAGPELLGEGPLFSGEADVALETYIGKQRMLERYRIIYRRIAGEFNIPYIDVRLAFLNALPKNYYGYQGCLTVGIIRMFISL